MTKEQIAKLDVEARELFDNAVINFRAEPCDRTMLPMAKLSASMIALAAMVPTEKPSPLGEEMVRAKILELSAQP